MAKTKYLSLAGLTTFVAQLKARGFEGMGLSEENFTAALKAKLEATATTEGLKELNDKVTALEALVQTDSDGVINKFNEIVAFLAGISDTKTLDGLLADVATQVADAKKAGTDAQTALDAFKETVYTKTDADATFVKSADLEAITDAEILSIVNPTAGA